eukprot:4875386-Prymnesium_polylepis.1
MASLIQRKLRGAGSPRKNADTSIHASNDPAGGDPVAAQRQGTVEEALLCPQVGRRPHLLQEARRRREGRPLPLGRLVCGRLPGVLHGRGLGSVASRMDGQARKPDHGARRRRGGPQRGDAGEPEARQRVGAGAAQPSELARDGGSDRQHLRAPLAAR